MAIYIFSVVQLKRRFISESRGDKTIQKCLALVILLKTKLKSSRIHHYSTNKLVKAARISHKTAKKYEKWLQDYNLVHFEGNSKNRILVVNSIASHTSNRNIGIDGIDCSSFFSTFRSLQAFIFMKLQYNKDFMRHLLQVRHNPESPKQFRKAKKQVKNLVKQGKLNGMDAHYKEYGLSLKRIAKEVGCCIRTVQRVIDFAEGYGWVTHQRNFEWFHTPHINHLEIDGFTFSTKHMLCIAHPNTYVLAASVSQALTDGMVFI